MKKGLLFIMTMIMMVSTVEAKIIDHRDDKLCAKRTTKVQPIVFVEKGVKFSILPNGKFKFKKLNSKNSLRAKNLHWKNQRGLNVLRDRKGRIVKVGKVNIFYSRDNKITQIGSVDLTYKHGRLKKVGNLYILQRPNGNFKYIGHVKKYNKRYMLKRPIIWS